MGPSFVRHGVKWGERKGEKGEEFTSTPGGISFVRLREVFMDLDIKINDAIGKIFLDMYFFSWFLSSWSTFIYRICLQHFNIVIAVYI